MSAISSVLSPNSCHFRQSATCKSFTVPLLRARPALKLHTLLSQSQRRVQSHCQRSAISCHHGRLSRSRPTSAHSPEICSEDGVAKPVPAWQKFASFLLKSTAVIALALALTFGGVPSAEAARSGGRMGGSSFIAARSGGSSYSSGGSSSRSYGGSLGGGASTRSYGGSTASASSSERPSASPRPSLPTAPAKFNSLTSSVTSTSSAKPASAARGTSVPTPSSSTASARINSSASSARSSSSAKPTGYTTPFPTPLATSSSSARSSSASSARRKSSARRGSSSSSAGSSLYSSSAPTISIDLSGLLNSLARSISAAQPCASSSTSSSSANPSTLAGPSLSSAEETSSAAAKCTPSASYATGYGSFLGPGLAGGYGYGYGGGFGGPVVQRSDGGGGFITILVVVAALFIASQVASNVFGGGDGNDSGSGRATVCKLQVGLLGSARSLQRDLERIAGRADTNTPDGLHYVLQETVLSLLRNPDYCVYGDGGTKNPRGLDGAEDAFNEVVLQERGKFKEETLVNVGGRSRRSSLKSRGDGMSELIVVTVIVAAGGGVKVPKVSSREDLTKALNKLGALRSEQILAVEVMWTPQDENDSYTRDELFLDYPTLNTL